MSKKVTVKWGFPVCTISRHNLIRLLYIMEIIHAVMIFFSIAILLVSIKMAINVGQYVNMVTDNDGHVLPGMLSLAAILMLPLNITGFIFLIQCKSKHMNTKLNLFLFIHFIITGILLVTIVAIAILCMNHTNDIHHKLHDGIKQAMHKYANDPVSKVLMDFLQMKYECCGSQSYKEWFNIPWLDASFGGFEDREGDFVSDDAPFSCCAGPGTGGSSGPCIHHGVMTQGVVYRYSPQRHLSLFSRGCKDVLVAEVRTIGDRVTLVLFFIALVLVILLIGDRLIQTAHIVKGRLEIHDIMSHHRHTVWMFGYYAQDGDTEEKVKMASKTKRKYNKNNKKKKDKRPLLSTTDETTN